ncbi:MAG: hypothetical protein HY720_09905 [Planctomycetes bacterium]|nr:hypothetical protein [Planctomycetota bacterium]
MSRTTRRVGMVVLAFVLGVVVTRMVERALPDEPAAESVHRVPARGGELSLTPSLLVEGAEGPGGTFRIRAGAAAPAPGGEIEARDVQIEEPRGGWTLQARRATVRARDPRAPAVVELAGGVRARARQAFATWELGVERLRVEFSRTVKDRATLSFEGALEISGERTEEAPPSWPARLLLRGEGGTLRIDGPAIHARIAGPYVLEGWNAIVPGGPPRIRVIGESALEFEEGTGGESRKVILDGRARIETEHFTLEVDRGAKIELRPAGDPFVEAPGASIEFLSVPGWPWLDSTRATCDGTAVLDGSRLRIEGGVRARGPWGELCADSIDAAADPGGGLGEFRAQGKVRLALRDIEGSCAQGDELLWDRLGPEAGTGVLLGRPARLVSGIEGTTLEADSFELDIGREGIRIR